MNTVISINRRARRFSATFPVAQSGLDPDFKAPPKPLIEPNIYGQGVGERFVGLDQIDLASVAMLSMREWVDFRKKGQKFLGRLLGDGDMLAILEQQSAIPPGWRKQRNVAKAERDDPSMINPRIHFGGRIFDGYVTFITFSGTDGPWFAGYQCLQGVKFDSSARLACLLYE